MSKKRADKEYEIGFGRPPKHSQFKKGQSGNPKGRPKEPATFLASLNNELSKDVKVMIDGQERKITGLSAVSKKYKNMILSGDYKYMKLFLDKNAKEVDIGPYIYPQDVPEIFPEGPTPFPTKPQREAVQEIKALIRKVIGEKIDNGEAFDSKPKE
jgi:hypothetical protein